MVSVCSRASCTWKSWCTAAMPNMYASAASGQSMRSAAQALRTPSAHRDLAGVRDRVYGQELAAYAATRIADALATITPALTSSGGAGRRPRFFALPYGHAFNHAQAGAKPGPALTAWRWPGRGVTHCDWPPLSTRR